MMKTNGRDEEDVLRGTASEEESKIFAMIRGGLLISRGRSRRWSTKRQTRTIFLCTKWQLACSSSSGRRRAEVRGKDGPSHDI